MNKKLIWFISFISIAVNLISNSSKAQESNLENSTQKARAFYEKAEFFRAQKNIDSCTYYFEKSIVLYQNANEWIEAFNAEISYSRVLARLGRNDAVIERLLVAIAKSDSLNLSNFRIAFLMNENLAIAYDGVGRHTKAVEYFQRFLGYSKQMLVNDTIFRAYLGKTYNNLAVSLMRSSRYELADIYFDSAIYELRRQNFDEPELEHVIYLNKGNVNRKLGYYLEANRYYEKSMSMINVPGMSKADKGLAWWYYANFFLQKNQSPEDLEKALQYADSAQAYLKNIPVLDLYCRYQYGQIYTDLKQFDKGLTELNSAIKFIHTNFGENYYELADVYTMVAGINLQMDEIDNAIAYLEKSIDIYENAYQENPESKALALIELGNCYFKKNDWVLSLKYYQESISLIQMDFQPEGLEENPSPENLVKSMAIYEALKRKALVFDALFRKSDDFKYLEAQLSCYELMIETIDLGKQELIELESKMIYNEKGYDVFKSAISASFEAFSNSGDNTYLEKAFQYCYRSKANELINKIYYANHRNTGNKSHNKLLLRVSDLKTAIGNLKKDIAFNSDSTLNEKLREDLFSNNELLRSLSDSINYLIPKTQKLAKKEIDIKNFQNQLIANNSILIKYIELNDRIIVFSLGKRLDAISLPYNDILKDSIRNYTASLENRTFKPALSYNLYLKLIAPILAKNLHDQQNLLLVPDGLLTMISFESLVSAPPSQNTPVQYLIEHYNITYSYSSLLNDLKNTQQDYQYTFVGFSPDYGGINALASRGGITNEDPLPPLPSAKKEVADISKIFNGRHLDGKDANETNFKELAQNSKYLHLAAHAISDNFNPLFSKVVLGNNSNSKEDGNIHAYEIYNMNLNADLVVLSACNTGSGKYQKGEGVISLASSFKYAGSKNLITSLWSVPDQPTSVIMNSFYQYLDTGKTKADALRSAKLDYLKKADKNTVNPYYWAGFILIGELEPEPASNLIRWLFAGSLLLIILVYFKFRKSN